MAIDVVRLYEKFKIDYKTSGPQISRGWVSTSCCFCGDTGYHLGYNQKISRFTCWKCGVKSDIKVIARLLNVSFDYAKKIADEFYVVGSKRQEAITHAKELILPENEGCLRQVHRKHIKDHGAGFDPTFLEQKYGLVGTLNYGDYSNRILIPIYYKGQLVSFSSRDITDKAMVKAKACKEENEVVHYKNLLYGFDEVPGNTVILSEGPWDKYRWGDEGLASWGIKLSQNQIDLLSCFRNIFIVFDSEIVDEVEKEKTARQRAEELADNLSIFTNVFLIEEMGEEPADISQRRADKMKSRFLELARKKDIEQRF